MLGKTLSRYTILEQIGSGGMGTVYRARDQRLNRDVAVKVLPHGLLADDLARHRFRKEALALSQLNHPNVATVHDFDSQEGVDFIVMEYIEGTTLNSMLSAGPMPERDILQFGQQAAHGLAAAHEHGIIHRDLKPANLRITSDRRLKILDFGLAELFRPSGDAGVTATATSASATGPPGTLPYMAPEQLREEKVDHRIDIYALGAALYEMATGQRPFPETRGPRLIDAILHHQPTRPSALNRRISPGLEMVILKCLDKDPDRRYQSARELGVDLNRLATGAGIAPSRVGRRAALAAVVLALLLLAGLAADLGSLRSRLFGSGRSRIRSIAVLPLENLSGNPEQEYFADGITETLISEFTRISELRVISRWSVMQYKGSRKPLSEVARELGVDAVILGSVLRTGDNVQLSIQFNHAASDTNLWANNYEVPASRILAFQNDVVQSIVREVQVQLTPQEQAHLARSGARTVNPQALEAYLLGRFHWNKRTPEAFKLALAEFERAVAIDPQYAPAYAGIADAHVSMISYNLVPARDFFSTAVEAARRALDLDESLAEAHISLAALLYLSLEPEEAERRFQRGLELNPGYATGRQWYALHLASRGRTEDALREIRRAQELEPLSLIISANSAWCLYLGRRFDEAVSQAQRTIQLNQNFAVAHEYLAQAFAAQGRFEDAITEMQRAVKLSPGTHSYRAGLASLFARASRRTEALELLRELQAQSKSEYVSAYDFAVIYVGLDNKDEAYKWLDKAREERSSRLVNLKVHPWFDSLRSDSRFQTLLRDLGIP
ncbi:MAG: protein kinase domain-containing protein [Candidatus Acidiferrales bacterium]